MELTGSASGYIAEAVPNQRGALELVVCAGTAPGDLAAVVTPTLRAGQADLSGTAATLPLPGASGLVGVVGLSGRPGGYDESLGASLLPLLLTAASLVVRAHAAAELRRRELATGNAIATWEQDLATGRLRADPLLGRWSGGAAWDEWHEPVDHRVARRQLDDCKGGLIPSYEYEATARRPDGEEMRLLVRGTFLRASDGQPSVAVGAAQDITEQRHIERARREHEARLRAVLDCALNALLVCAESGDIVAASRSARKLFGFTELELVGRNIGALLGEPVRGRDGMPMRLWDKSGVAPLRKRQRTQGVRKDGSWFSVEYSVAEARLGPQPLFAVALRDLSGDADRDTPVFGVPVKQTRDPPSGGFERTSIGSVTLEADGTPSFVSEGCRAIAGLETLIRDAAARRLVGPRPVRIAGRATQVEVELRSDPDDRGRRHAVVYEAGPSPPPPALPWRASMVGDSPPMRRLRASIEQVAAGDWTVLVEGETGSGKELVARAIHAASPRRNGPLIVVNCAVMTDTLLQSQLFGHVRGTFTGATNDQQGLVEAAAGGTLFLDEIGDISPDVQRAILRVLEDKEVRRLGKIEARKVDVRIVSATHRDLAQRVAEGKFREDLLYRIRVARVQVPPLRERLEDIPVLVNSFLSRQTVSFGKVVTAVGPAAMERLFAHPWPGNVRELRSAVGHAVIHCRGSRIEAEDLPPELAAPGPAAPAPPDERQRILDALRRASGNRSRAARLLGIGRATLYRRLEDLDITVIDDDDPAAP
jgi:PAS domain S-box-containing protein